MTQTITQSAAVPLHAYQHELFHDDARFQFWLMARQTGKSFTASLKIADHAVATGQTWVCLSAGERQSKELMEKVKMHLEALGIAASAIEEDFFDDAETKQLMIRLPNGARIIGLPANPDTARGFSANVFLDEFAFHRDSEKIWRALYPTITRGYRLIIATTPQGKSNRAYRLWSSEDNGFSKHLIDIYAAVNGGLTLDPDELRRGIDDEEAWQQEYLCQFIDEASAFLTYDLIAACESDTGKLDSELDASHGPIFVGIDIGRKRDLTVIWVLQKVGDVFVTRQVRCLDKMPYRQQAEVIAQVITAGHPYRVCIDATGIGNQLAEGLAYDFGGVVEPVVFTNEVKKDLAHRVLPVMQDRRLRLPIDSTIREDLHSVKKVTTAAGNIRFDAERTKDGHADRFWAMALALHAADEAHVKPQIILCG